MRQAFFGLCIEALPVSGEFHARHISTRYFPVNSKSLIGPLIADCYALSVDSKTIRRNNLRQLFGQYGSQKAFAEAAGLDPGHVSQMNTGHRAVGDKIARHIETALKLTHGWMDAQHHAAEQERAVYTLAPETEILAAVEKFRALDPAFRAYIMLKMDELASCSAALAPFVRKQLQPPTGDTYAEWERDMAADIARLRASDSQQTSQVMSQFDISNVLILVTFSFLKIAIKPHFKFFNVLPCRLKIAWVIVF